MITINGKKYAKNDNEFTNSIFDPSGTCSGYYRRRKDGVLLMDMQKVPFGFIKVESACVVYAVSAYQHNGKTRYMFGLTSCDSERLGLNNLRYSEQGKYLFDAIRVA